MSQDPPTTPAPESASPLPPDPSAAPSPPPPPNPPPAPTSSATTAAASPAPESSRRKLPLKTIGIAAIGLICVLVIARFIPTFGSSPEDARRRLELKELHAAEAVQKEAEALALAKLQEFANRGDKAEAAVTDFETELARWDREVVPLLTTDAGRTLAAHEDFALAFDALLQRSRPTRKDASALRAAVSALTEPINSHLRISDASYTPSDAVKEQLELQRADALADAAAYHDAREQIERMLTDAAKSGTTASAQTLREAIDAIKARTAATEAAKIVDDQRQTQVTRDERTDAERAKYRAQAERLVNDPGNLAMLEPFFAKGTSRFTRHGPDGTIGCRAAGCTRFETAGPASWSDLVKSGVFTDTKSFLCAIRGYKGSGDLFYFFCRDDRPVYRSIVRADQENEVLEKMLGTAAPTILTGSRRAAFLAYIQTSMDALDLYICDDDKAAFRRSLDRGYKKMIDGFAADFEERARLQKGMSHGVDEVEKTLLGSLPNIKRVYASFLERVRQSGEYWVESGRLRP